MSTENSIQSNLFENLEITAYTEGPAVIGQVQVLNLVKGNNRASIKLLQGFVAGSFTITHIGGEGMVEVTAISYTAESLTIGQMLEQSIFQEITISDHDFPGGEKLVKGILLHILGDHLILLSNDKRVEVVSMVDGQRYNLPATAFRNLSPHPSLKLEIYAKVDYMTVLRTLYAVDGLRWTKHFDIFYDSADGVIERFVCWIDLTNNTGNRIEEARFKLIEGISNYGANQYRNRCKTAVHSMGSNAPSDRSLESGSFGPGSVSEDIGEQKIYVLPQLLQIESRESKKVTLFAAEDVPVSIEYFLPHGEYRTTTENCCKLPVFKSLKIKNEQSSNLGIAIPSGPVRVFEADYDQRYHGTDHSTITAPAAVGETFKLILAQPSLTIKAIRRLRAAAEEEEAQHSEVTYREETREVELFNYKSSPVEVVIYESLPTLNLEFIEQLEGASEVNETFGGASIKVIVPANGTTKVTYTIRFLLD